MTMVYFYGSILKNIYSVNKKEILKLKYREKSYRFLSDLNSFYFSFVKSKLKITLGHSGNYEDQKSPLNITDQMKYCENTLQVTVKQTFPSL